MSNPDDRYPPVSPSPVHVGMIMDGNGRWARRRGLPRLAGHRAGVENLRRVLRAAVELGIPIVTLYAFSSENWQRPAEEVHGLLNILREALEKEVGELHKNGVQLRHIGDLTPLSDDLKEQIQAAVELTRNNDRLIANIAFNYGGRQEIVEAVRKIIRAGVPPEAVTEALINEHLYTAGIPDVDLIIRTSGEMRISNFLIWQGAYAEYYITPVYWPDFDKDELYAALKAFSQRDRRYGGLNT
ncbi:MAG TPA: polyprenyl diphosphate synthase [Anaerolineae bacterium]|nr:polyprenyl diphosphate synthase [Anaerolineae bacterium]HQK15619.1 polyprenyl diphosphate synthase [Anaerolineae bacterium]